MPYHCSAQETLFHRNFHNPPYLWFRNKTLTKDDIHILFGTGIHQYEGVNKSFQAFYLNFILWDHTPNITQFFEESD